MDLKSGIFDKARDISRSFPIQKYYTTIDTFVYVLHQDRNSLTRG